MVLKNKKLKKRNFFRSSAFFYLFLGVLALLIIGFLVNTNLKLNKKRNEFLAQIHYLEKEIQALEEKKAKYQSAALQLETETFWEEKIREQGYKKPGEEVVVVTHQEEVSREEAQREKGFWEKLSDFIRGFW